MLDDLLRPPPEEVLQVTDLTRRIKACIEADFSRMWVRGEVSNLRRQSSGHVYFSLKDGRSQLPCVLFARDAARQSFEPEDGMEILLFGDVSVYEPHGRYQLIARVAFRAGEGKLQAEFEKLKRKLAAEGLFDRERKRPLAARPERVAVITSESGAALRDFLRILRRRDYRGTVTVFPARVQGTEAAAEIMDRLERVNASGGYDLVVLTRGGGSIEDLWPFNEEPLARAVAASATPVLSAIGHEIDTVLTDFAADERAETPSGAAERISSLHLETVRRLEEFAAAIARALGDTVARRTRVLHDLETRLQRTRPERRVDRLAMRLDDLEGRLGDAMGTRLGRERERLGELRARLVENHPRAQLALFRQNLRDRRRRLERASADALHNHRRNLDYLAKRLDNSSLNASLRRGFAILEGDDGTVLRSAAEASRAERLRARMHDGAVRLRKDAETRQDEA